MCAERLQLISKNNFGLLFILASTVLFGCNGSSSNSSSSTQAPVSNINALSCKSTPDGGNYDLLNPATGTNVLPVVLNGNYANEPTVTLTICQQGTNNCVSVDNILVDTGSYGLRVFGSTLSSITLSQINAPSGHPLAECAQFGIGSTWGPIKTADVVMGGEAAVTIPIQVIDSTFGTKPSGCSDADTDPSSAGYNGILGVGLFKEDCGTTCTTGAPDLYYSCNGTTCTASNAPLASQVVNPVAKETTDNNGVILELPDIPACGVQNVTGTLTLGIGTKANNTPGSVTTFAANAYGEFTTVFSGNTYTDSFIDSGSNALFFPRVSSLPACNAINGTDISAFDCPNDSTTFTATQVSGSTSKNVSFTINNARNMFLSNNYNFKDIAVNWSSAFNWGLPFFYGRKVYVGIENKVSGLGTGPYWAY